MNCQKIFSSNETKTLSPGVLLVYSHKSVPQSRFTSRANSSILRQHISTLSQFQMRLILSSMIKSKTNSKSNVIITYDLEKDLNNNKSANIGMKYFYMLDISMKEKKNTFAIQPR